MYCLSPPMSEPPEGAYCNLSNDAIMMMNATAAAMRHEFANVDDVTGECVVKLHSPEQSGVI